MTMFAGRVGPGDYAQSKRPQGQSRSRLPDGRELVLVTADQPGPLQQSQSDHGRLLLIGRPRSVADRSTAPELPALTEQLARAPLQALASLDGHFALAWLSTDAERLLLATDRFASYPLFYRLSSEEQLFSTDYRWLCQWLASPTIDPQAIYDYLFFTTIPSNRCLHAGIQRLPPASLLSISAGKAHEQRYWQPDFHREPASRRQLESGLHDALGTAVDACVRHSDCGGFLSGGLDSSTVCGLAAGAVGRSFPVYTMGFDEPGYDETDYARVTARHFDLALHEHQVTADEVLECLQRLIPLLPEPFGNPSLLSTLICAQVAAADGVKRMLAGDGGDELFAGNERYQKQLLFEQYFRLPAGLRKQLLEPLGHWLAARNLPGLPGRAGSYFNAVSTPLPRRMYRYNLLERYSPAAALTPAFLAGVDTDGPLSYLEQLYREPETGDFLDRLLYLDWTVTLADNDLRKVRMASEAAGVETLFPMLHLPVVETATRIPSDWKLNRRELRAFYKQAMRDFLPPEIIRKPKHGFGVPVGGWLRRHAGLRELVYAGLERLKQREILSAGFIDEIVAAQRSGHAVYFGALLWPMFMLECWLAEHAAGYGATR